jgi:DNA gyrase subunit A
MATNIPPHNLGEVIDGCIALIDNPAIELLDLMQHHSRPGFPDRRADPRPCRHPPGLRDRSRLRHHARPRGYRADARRPRADHHHEVPFQVNKASMIEKMAELVRDKRIEGISDLRDESDRQGYRVVIELKRDANAEVILNQLYRFTPLQTSFGCNMVALNGGKPEQMTLLDMLRAFVAFREEVVSRRTKYLLARPATAPMSWSASPSPSPISTR